MQQQDTDMTRDVNMTQYEPTTSYVSVGLGLLTLPLSMWFSWWTLSPREEAVVIQCGVFTDAVKEQGLHYHSCIGREIRVMTTAQQSVDIPTQKLTDSAGNPILVSCVLTYRVVDPTSALLNVREPNSYVQTQATAAIKIVLSKYTYDELKHQSEEVSAEIVKVLQPKVDVCGAKVQGVMLNELNYAPEIASAMLRKQAAQATVDARHLIVKGAVDISLSAITQLEESGMKFDEAEKLKLVSALLIVTTGDKDAVPTMTVM